MMNQKYLHFLLFGLIAAGLIVVMYQLSLLKTSNEELQQQLATQHNSQLQIINLLNQNIQRISVNTVTNNNQPQNVSKPQSAAIAPVVLPPPHTINPQKKLVKVRRADGQYEWGEEQVETRQVEPKAIINKRDPTQ